MALIDTDKIAHQFGEQAKNVVEAIADQGLSEIKNIVQILETKDLVITIRLQDRV
jgi:hypothetical protein